MRLPKMHSACCRVKKYGPVFRSNIFGSDVVVVTDFVGLQKARLNPSQP